MSQPVVNSDSGTSSRSHAVRYEFTFAPRAGRLFGGSSESAGSGNDRANLGKLLNNALQIEPPQLGITEN